MEVVLLGTVTLRGKDVHAGAVIDIPEDSAASLVEAGLAEEVPVEAQNDAPGNSTDEGDTIVPNDGEAALDMTTRALNDQYKRDELAAAAKAAGVDFPYDAKKAEIVAAVMLQGLEAALLK